MYLLEFCSASHTMTSHSTMVRSELTMLVQERFGSLSQAELTLSDSAMRGVWAECREAGSVGVRFGATWSEAQTVRSDLIRWICTNNSAREHVDPRGLRIRGARLTEPLDLSYVTVDFPLFFHECYFDSGVLAGFSRVKALSFSGSVLKNLYAPGMIVSGDLDLNGRFRANKGVNLEGSRIEGDLNCATSRLSGGTRAALSITRAMIRGKFSLSRAVCRGEVRMIAAEIGNNLGAAGAVFHHPSGDAIRADGVRVGGDVVLTHNAKIRGSASFIGIFVGDTFNCVGASVSSNEGTLGLDGADVRGHVILGRGFHSQGTVRLIACKIGLDLVCTGGTFINGGEISLLCDRIKVSGAVFLNDEFCTDGQVRFVSGTIEGNFYCNGSLYYESSRVGLHFRGCRIGGALSLKNVNHQRAPAFKLNLERASVGELVDAESSWPSAGKLFLNGFEYGAVRNLLTATDRTRWLQLQPPRPHYPQPYEQLSAVYRRAGHEEEARTIAINKRRARTRWGGLGLIARLKEHLLELLLGYGYQPWRSLVAAALLWITGGVIFSQSYRAQVLAPARDRIYLDTAYLNQGRIPEAYPRFAPLVFSADVFLPIVNLHQEEYWTPVARRPCQIVGYSFYACGTATRWYFWAHILLGWGLTTLFVSGLTGLVRRD